jgi:hypothetical protein
MWQQENVDRGGGVPGADMGWTEVLAVEDEKRWARLSAQILASGACQSTGETVRASVRQSASRVTFFNCRRYGVDHITTVMW